MAKPHAQHSHPLAASVAGLPHRLAVNLRTRATAAQAVSLTDHHSMSFAFCNLRRERATSIRAELRQAIWPCATTIYVLRLTDGAAAELIRQGIGRVRAAKTRAYPRVNAASDAIPETCLYVGQSSNTPKRLYEHLIEAPKQTYALHLSHWAQGIPGHVWIDVFRFDDAEPWLMQALEDYLAMELKPILGKRGPK